MSLLTILSSAQMLSRDVKEIACRKACLPSTPHVRFPDLFKKIIAPTLETLYPRQLHKNPGDDLIFELDESHRLYILRNALLVHKYPEDLLILEKDNDLGDHLVSYAYSDDEKTGFRASLVGFLIPTTIIYTPARLNGNVYPLRQILSQAAEPFCKLYDTAIAQDLSAEALFAIPERTKLMEKNSDFTEFYVRPFFSDRRINPQKEEIH